jgi:hypothetical protein
VLDFLVTVLLMVAQKFPVDGCDAVVAGVIAWADLSAVGVVTIVAVVRALLLIWMLLIIGNHLRISRVTFLLVLEFR